ncbi:unnamed protein product, partial [Rotaria sp. Silwood1]
FICFVIGASCSARFKSQCTAYTVIAAFALVSSIIVIITEFVHFFRLWTYNPTDTRNTSNTNSVYSTDSRRRIEKTHRHHLGFIHYSLLNDQNADKFRDSRCEKGNDCKSYSLHHHLLYHTLESEHDIALETLSNNEKRSFIAFYETTRQEALDIAQNGFPYGDTTNTGYKDYLHLKQSIFFTRSCKREGSSPTEAIICVRLNLGRTLVITSDTNPNLNDYFGLRQSQPIRSSFITFIANFIYIFLRYLGPIIFESDREKVGCCSQSFAWNLSTLTCFRCECYREHPQLILITRFTILVVFEVMRFIAFILACVCANRYGPIGLGYSILAAFSLVPAVILLVVEYLHHHRLWFHYRPDCSLEEKPHYIKEHLRFLPIAMTNDQQ